jgi:sortase A
MADRTIIERQWSTMRGSRLLVWTRRVLFAIGALAVSYVALALLQARLYQRFANNILEEQIHAEGRHQASPPLGAAQEGDVLGRIEIPRLGMKVAILEGTTSRILQLGVGHIAGTALPGEPGNIAIAGHRDTFFRSLKDIRTHDEIQIQTASDLSQYEVDGVQIVEPANIAVLAPSTDSALTLVTCYPFHFIGAAPMRFVVHAHKKQKPDVLSTRLAPLGSVTSTEQK